MTIESDLTHYATLAKKFPMLTKEREAELFALWLEKKDPAARDEIINAHLTLLIPQCKKLSNYGIPLGDLFAEGVFGISKAVEKFEPERDLRFNTYARWWIRASMINYIVKNWSLVTVASTSSKRKLFFNLKSTKAKLGIHHDNALSNAEIKMIADHLCIGEQDIEEMNSRIRGDTSLNARGKNRAESGETDEWLDLLTSDNDNQFQVLANEQDEDLFKELIQESFQKLTDRERDVVIKRYLKEDVETLREISETYNVSRERVRQIEVKALSKIKKYLTINSVRATNILQLTGPESSSAKRAVSR